MASFGPALIVADHACDVAGSPRTVVAFAFLAFGCVFSFLVGQGGFKDHELFRAWLAASRSGRIADRAGADRVLGVQLDEIAYRGRAPDHRSDRGLPAISRRRRATTGSTRSTRRKKRRNCSSAICPMRSRSMSRTPGASASKACSPTWRSIQTTRTVGIAATAIGRAIPRALRIISVTIFRGRLLRRRHRPVRAAAIALDSSSSGSDGGGSSGGGGGGGGGSGW